MTRTAGEVAQHHAGPCSSKWPSAIKEDRLDDSAASPVPIVAAGKIQTSSLSIGIINFHKTRSALVLHLCQGQRSFVEPDLPTAIATTSGSNSIPKAGIVTEKTARVLVTTAILSLQTVTMSLKGLEYQRSGTSAR